MNLQKTLIIMEQFSEELDRVISSGYLHQEVNKQLEAIGGQFAYWQMQMVVCTVIPMPSHPKVLIDVDEEPLT